MVPTFFILTQDTYYKKVAWFGAGHTSRGEHTLPGRSLAFSIYSKSFREISDSMGEFM